MPPLPFRPFDEVKSQFTEDSRLSRDIKIYLCTRYTGERLKKIGEHFKISESAVSHASKRISERMIREKKLKKMIEKIEKKILISRFNDLTPLLYIGTVPAWMGITGYRKD